MRCTRPVPCRALTGAGPLEETCEILLLKLCDSVLEEHWESASTQLQVDTKAFPPGCCLYKTSKPASCCEIGTSLQLLRVHGAPVPRSVRAALPSLWASTRESNSGVRVCVCVLHLVYSSRASRPQPSIMASGCQWSRSSCQPSLWRRFLTSWCTGSKREGETGLRHMSFYVMTE